MADGLYNDTLAAKGVPVTHASLIGEAGVKRVPSSTLSRKFHVSDASSDVQ